MLYEDLQDIPIDDFHKCLEAKDFKYLVIHEGKLSKYVRKIEKSKIVTIKLYKLFEKLNNQLFEVLGASVNYEMLYYKRDNLIRYEMAFLEGDESAQTFIELLKIEIETIEQAMHEQVSELGSIKEFHAKLHLKVKREFNCDTHNMKALEFYVALKEIDSNSEQYPNRLEKVC
jgi:hypothetical protein